MLMANLGQVVLLCLLVHIHAEMDYIYDNEEESVHILNSECNGTITERFGSIEISYNEIFNDFKHFCSLYVENATQFYLMFFQMPTELSENFYNVSGLINILLYDHDPAGSGGLPVYEIKDEGVSTVAVVPGNRVWLAINMNIDELTSGSRDFDDIHWFLAYVAVVDHFLPGCNASGLEEIENGVYRVRNNTFGSVADLECSDGFILDNVSRFATCSVIDNVLSWIPGTAVCSSVCEHPPIVAHASMNPQMDTTFTVDNSRTSESTEYPTESDSYTRTEQREHNTSPASSSLTPDDTQGESSIHRRNINPTTTYDTGNNNTGNNDTRRRTGNLRSNGTLGRTNALATSERLPRNETLRANVTVYYTCNQPYILSGQDRIHCGADERGIQRWFDPPPSCIIPDCSQTIVFREASGAIVNPSYPETTLKGGSQVCTWQIEAPGGAYILLSTLNVQLPDEPGVEVSVLDSGTPRPVQLLQLTNDSHLQNVTSESSKVTVIYHGPSQDISGYHGFYIQYLIQESDVLRKAIDSSTATLKEQTGSNPGLTERSTSNPAQPTLNQTTEPVATENPENTVTPTFAQSTNQSTEEYASETRDDPRTAQPTLSQTTEPVATENLENTVTPTFAQSTNQSTEEYASETRDDPRTAQPTLSQTTEPVAIENPENTVMSTFAHSTKQSTEKYASETRDELINHTTQQTTNQPIENITSSAWKTSAGITNHTFHNTTTSLAPVTSRNETLTITDDTDDSSDVWKIAIGVIIPLCALVLVLFCVFVCFRQKYPVRMTIGRDVTKLCNPQYATPVDCPALVRENASTLFSKIQSDMSSEEPAPEKHCVVFENLGFSADDSEDEQNQKYMEAKKWLFGETNEAFETSSLSAPDSCSESESTGRHPLQLKSENQLDKTEKKAKVVNGARSMVLSSQLRHNKESEVAKTETLDQKPGPLLSPQETNRNGEHSDFECTPTNNAESVPAFDEDSDRSSSSSHKSESIDINSESTQNRRDEEEEEEKEEEESGFMKSSMILFQQPTFEEVWARVKARSKSLGWERPVVEVKPRSCTVDPGKSARKMSLHDDLTPSEHFKLMSSSSRSDQHLKTSSSVNIDDKTATTVPPFLAQYEKKRSLKSSPQSETEYQQPVDSVSSNEDGKRLTFTSGSFRQNGHDENRNNKSCTELKDYVDENDCTDNMISDSKNEGINNCVAATGLQISNDDPKTPCADSDAINSTKMSSSNSFNAEITSPLEGPGVDQEESTHSNSSAAESETGARRCSYAEQINSHYSLENKEFPLSGTSTKESDSNLFNRTNLKHNSLETGMQSLNGNADSQEVALSDSIIEADVDDISDDIINNLNDCSDDESTGVKVTDSDISDILNSSDETEPGDSDAEFAGVENVNSNNPETSINLQQDSESNDRDV